MKKLAVPSLSSKVVFSLTPWRRPQLLHEACSLQTSHNAALCEINSLLKLQTW